METKKESEPPAKQDAQKQIHEFIVREMNINLVRSFPGCFGRAKLMSDDSIPNQAKGPSHSQTNSVSLTATKTNCC